MWKFIPLLLILPGILPCKQRQRPHWSADGGPDLVKVEDKHDLKKSPSVRGLQASNLIITDRHKLYTPPTTPRIPTPRTVNEDGSDVHCDPAKVPSKEIVLQTIGLLRKQNNTFTWPFPNNRLTTKAPNTPTPRDVDVWEFSQNKPYTTPPTPNTRDLTTEPSYPEPPTIGP